MKDKSSHGIAVVLSIAFPTYTHVLSHLTLNTQFATKGVQLIVHSSFIAYCHELRTVTQSNRNCISCTIFVKLNVQVAVFVDVSNADQVSTAVDHSVHVILYTFNCRE